MKFSRYKCGWVDDYVMAGMAPSVVEQKMQTLVKPKLSLCLHLIYSFVPLLYQNRHRLSSKPEHPPLSTNRGVKT